MRNWVKVKVKQVRIVALKCYSQNNSILISIKTIIILRNNPFHKILSMPTLIASNSSITKHKKTQNSLK